MTGAASRRRGADAERAVVNYLRANGWPDARRYLAGDGRQPGDIDFAPGVCLEVKDRASSAWPTWRAQTLAEAGDRIPIVVRRTRGVTDVGQWPAQMLWWTWWTWTRRAADVGYTDCDRTGRAWVQVPFAAIVAELKVDR